MSTLSAESVNMGNFMYVNHILDGQKLCSVQSSHGLVTLASFKGVPQFKNAIISKPMIFLIFMFILFLYYETLPTKCRNPQLCIS